MASRSTATTGAPGPYTTRKFDACSTSSTRRERFLAAHGIAYVVTIAPDKATIYPEHLPGWATQLAPRTPLDRLTDALRVDGTVRYVDLRGAAARGQGARARVLRDRLALELPRRPRGLRRTHAGDWGCAVAEVDFARAGRAARLCAGRRRVPWRPRAHDGRRESFRRTRLRAARQGPRVAAIPGVASASTRARNRASSGTPARVRACRARSSTAIRWRSR